MGYNIIEVVLSQIQSSISVHEFYQVQSEREAVVNIHQNLEKRCYLQFTVEVYQYFS